MTWVTVEVCKLEGRERTARSLRAADEFMRLAVWRMDSFLNVLIAPEAARPYGDYRCLRKEERAYDYSYKWVGNDSVRTMSPLIAFRSDLLQLHFEIAPDGSLSSPQLPEGNDRDLCEMEFPDLEDRQGLEERMADLEALIAGSKLLSTFAEAARAPFYCQPEKIPVAQGNNDFQNRAWQSSVSRNPTQNAANVLVARSVTSVGTLVPVWVGEESGRRLLFVREVRTTGGVYYQGFLVDDVGLRRQLLEQIEDLLPHRCSHVELEPCAVSAADPDPAALTTVPLRLVARGLGEAAPIGWSSARTVLATAWGALLLALTTVGFTLRRALDLGQRRARFASAVTHELRSPLTTFRMYAEMLDEGMVTDEGQRAEYLATLHQESDRLARLVENVLAYARLEEGRHGFERRDTTLGDLVQEVAPVLERRTAAARLELKTVVDDGSAAVSTDPEAVAQILFGLVDNACKHAAGSSSEPCIELCAAAEPRSIVLRVRDHGPGIPESQRRSIFRAFERGDEVEGPGVGLGLSIARSLTAALEGQLTLDEVSEGACFVLRLPRRAAT